MPDISGVTNSQKIASSICAISALTFPFKSIQVIPSLPLFLPLSRD